MGTSRVFKTTKQIYADATRQAAYIIKLQPDYGYFHSMGSPRYLFKSSLLPAAGIGCKNVQSAHSTS
jgi:hypothetical protein